VNRMEITLALAAMALCAVAAAGPYDQPYGLIESGQRLQAQKQEPAAMSRIDGVSVRNPRKSDPLTPGKHVVDVSFSSSRTVVGDTLQAIEIDVQPCKRYRIAAKYQSQVSGNWEPVLQAVEDIGECKRKFLSGAAK